MESPTNTGASPIKLSATLDQSRSLSPEPIRSPSPKARVSRNRREVERYGLNLQPVATEKVAKKSGSGSGVALGSIEATNDRLTKLDSDSEILKRLHTVVYGSVGKASTRKRVLRLWNGTEDVVSREAIKRGLALTRSLALLKDVAGVLGLEKSKDRPTLEAALADYLCLPSAKVSKRPVKINKPKKTAKMPLKKTKTAIAKSPRKAALNSSSSSSSSSDSDSSSDSSSEAEAAEAEAADPAAMTNTEAV